MESSKHAKEYVGVAILFAIIFLFHAGKSLGYPTAVYPDETYYSFATRFESFSEVPIPNYLYYAVYRSVNWFGQDFLDAARVINAIFYMAAGIFIYQIARMVCDARLSVYLTTVSLLLPPSLYTQFFMPESMFFACFWALAWLILRCRKVHPGLFGLISGAGIAALALVKVHGMFLLAGFVLFVILDEPEVFSRIYVKRCVLAIGAALLSFGVVKAGVGYLFAGPAGITLLGRDYGSGAVDIFAVFNLPRYLWYCLTNGWGVVLGLCLLFGLPLTLFIQYAFGDKSDGNAIAARRLSSLGLAVLATYAMVSCLYSGTLELVLNATQSVHYQWLIMGRYYNFIYPAFIIVTGYAYRLSSAPGGAHPLWVRCCHWSILVLAIYAAVYRFWGYNLITASHYPEIAPLFKHHLFEACTVIIVSSLIFAIGIVSCVVWRFAQEKACKCFLFLFLPVYIFFMLPSMYMESRFVAEYMNPYVVGGQFIKEYLDDELPDLAIVSVGMTRSYIVRYYLENKDVPITILDKKGPVELAKVAPGKKWLLLIGWLSMPRKDAKYFLSIQPSGWSQQYAVNIDEVESMKKFKYALVRLADFNYNVDLRAAKHPWPVRSVNEIDGRLAVRFAKPLPERLRIRLEVTPEGEAGGAAFELSMPGLREPVTVLGSGSAVHEYVVENAPDNRTLWLERIPGAGNAGQKRVGTDSRPLRLIIVPIDAAGNELPPEE